MAFVPLAGFVPDADPTMPGVLIECDGWVPTTKGMRTAPSALDAGYDALSAACVGYHYSRLSDGTTRCYAGTATTLNELSSGSWVSRGTGYTSTPNWRWVTIGNVTYATNLYNKILQATTGSFATITEAPKAAAIASSYGFLFAANYDTGTSVPDGVYWSAQYDPEDWTVDVATQCGNTRLLDTPGPILALRTLNEQIVAYKERSLYVGIYQGQSPYFWVFRLLSGDIGAVGQESVVDVGYAHFFVGYNDLWVFDGSVPRSIGAGIKEWFFRNVNRVYMGSIKGLFDRDRSLVYWFYPSNASTTLDKFICYNIITGKWGAGSQALEFAAEALTTGETYNSLWDGLTWDTLPTNTYDDGSLSASRPYPSIMTTAHKIAYLSGVSGSSSFTTGRVGNEEQVALLRQVSPRWFYQPTAASVTNYYASTAGATMTMGVVTGMDVRKRFSLLRAARWHALKLSTTGDAELAGITIDAIPQGRE